MKIRDLDKGRYIVVYDMGKSEYSEGMTVVGKIVGDLEYDEDGKNKAIIESYPFQRYTVTDDNYFDYWEQHMEDKTERVSKTSIKWNENNNLELDDGHEIEVPDELIESNANLAEYISDEIKKHQSNDVQQRKRNKNKVSIYELKPGDYVKVENEDGFRKGKVIATTKPKSELNLVSVADDYDEKIFFIDNTSEIELIQRNDMVNSPSHYNYGDIEVIDYCDQVCKTYPPQLAPYVFNAIKYLSRANYKNGREDINKAKYYVQRLFDMWDVK